MKIDKGSFINDFIDKNLRQYSIPVYQRNYEWSAEQCEKLFEDILLSVGDVFMEVIHEYPDITVHLTLFNATIAEGEPKKLEHNDIQWITPSEIPNYEFCPADEEILAKICEVYK